MASESENPASLSQRAIRSSVFKVRAVCGNSARTDLCGGRPVMAVPTAIAVDSREGNQKREEINAKAQRGKGAKGEAVGPPKNGERSRFHISYFVFQRMKTSQSRTQRVAKAELFVGVQTLACSWYRSVL